MTGEKILQSNLLDIIFENRNKQYGAYILRSQYNKHITKALGFIFLITLSMILLSQWKNELIKSVEFDIPVIETIVCPISEIRKPPLIPKVPAPKSAGSLASTAKFINNILITKDSLSEILLPNNLDSAAIGSKTSVGNSNSIVGTEPGPLEIKTTSAKEQNMDKEMPLLFAEVMPVFPGGTNALQKFLERNLASPADIELGEIVSVKIKFIVGYDGILKGFEIIEDGGKVFNNEVIRVLKKMPSWIPGKSRGENVSVYYTIPVKFTGKE